MNDIEERKVLDSEDIEKSDEIYDIENIEEEKIKKGFEISKLILVFFFILSVAFVGFIFLYNIFDTKKKFFIISLILIFNALAFTGILKNVKYKKTVRFIVSIFMILLMALMITFSLYYLKLDNSIKKMNQNVESPSSEKKFETKDIKDSESFNIYISGIDIGGDLAENSRSDVNIILSFNPKEGKVLLTSVPRDTYLPIADGGHDQYDKLTHAGNYGVMSSLHTLERFLEIKIPYFVRVNFDSVVRIVDELGGVDIYIDEDFTSRVNHKYYPKGHNHLNGEDALAFVRERYGLSEGDIGRGKNQEKLIAAIIKKVSKPSVLRNIDGLLKIMEENVVTNLSTKSLVDMAVNQLISGTDYKVKSQTLVGHYTLDLPSYAMPDHRLSMMVPSEESLEKVREEINKVVKNTYEKPKDNLDNEGNNSESNESSEYGESN